MVSTSSSNPSLIPAQLPPADTSVEDTGAGAGNSGGLPPGNDVPTHESHDSNIDNNDNNAGNLGKDAGVDNSETAGDTPRGIQESSEQPSSDSLSKGNDVPSAPDTSGTPSGTTRPIGGLITLDQSLKLAMTGILPKDGSSTADGGDNTPSRYVLPAPRGLDENSFLVVVPAHPAAYRAEAYVQDGYGGTEAMMIFDGLTNQDLDDLGRMLDNHVEVREMTLRPYVEREPPSVVNLEITLNSLSMRREMASILTHQVSTQSSGGVTIQDTALRSKYDNLCRDFGFLEKYREQEAAAVPTEMKTVKTNLESDFGSMPEERAALESRLNDRIQKLEGQLEDANRTIGRLKQENQSALDADRLMTFLNDHGNNIRGRWPRLRHLLRHFQKGTTPPASWRTWVTVEAVDKPFRMASPYPGPRRSDSEASDDEGAPSGDTLEREEKSEDRPPPSGNSPASDAKGTPSKSESQSQSKSQSPTKQPRRGPVKLSHPTSQLMRLTSMKSQDGDIEVQSRPSTHPESDKRALPHDGHLKNSTQDIAGRLPDFVAWSDLRKDVLLTMQMSFGYALSVEMMGEDKMAHHRFPEASLVDMLIPPDDVSPLSGRDQVDEVQLCDVMKDSLNAHETIEIEDSDEKDDPDDEDDADDADADSDTLSKTSATGRKLLSSFGSSDEDDETPKPKTKSSSKRARPLSTSSSDASTDYNSKSPLAMKRYRELTKSELAEIEIPARSVVSWRHRGILIRFSPVKDVAQKQTPGFPDYAPQMTEIVHLKDRWMPMEKSYRKLMATKPWKDMYSNRVKTLYFHERKKVTPVAIRLLDEHVAYMRKHARAFYEILHWFTMKTKPGRDEDGDDPSLYDKSATLHLEQSKRHEAVDRPFESRIAKLIERGLPATMV
ncbi:Hypothetical protein PHPALM_14447 [Phytophthora palmivora]|uniref:Uncharacterized protein n=1 Tax=Phytophthora palmivora TaxID=4796 RepID=A0A2P4XUR0_9STRA|nr:Hypothetical protein PHPALM_14447 [Phytophthora palmivora]